MAFDLFNSGDSETKFGEIMKAHQGKLHPSVEGLFKGTDNDLEKIEHKRQLDEIRYQRFMACQELIIEKVNKLEYSLSKIEGLGQSSLDQLKQSRFIEENFWNEKSFDKDDRIKKATYFAFFVLLAVAVGMLIPYFKSEKLVLVNNDQTLQRLKDNTQKNIDVMNDFKNEKPKKSYVSAKFVNLRQDPSSTGRIIKTIGPNQLVELEKTEGDWMKIRHFDHVKKEWSEGWSFNEFFVPSNL